MLEIGTAIPAVTLQDDAERTVRTQDLKGKRTVIFVMLLLGYHSSVATAVGMIALVGVAAEFGVIMLVYLDKAVQERFAKQQMHTIADLQTAIMEGAVLRIRPKAMTVSVIIAGLIPIMLGHGTGSEVMQRIAAPMVGGMITAPLLSLFVVPAVYLIWKARALHLVTNKE